MIAHRAPNTLNKMVIITAVTVLRHAHNQKNQTKFTKGPWGDKHHTHTKTVRSGEQSVSGKSDMSFINSDTVSECKILQKSPAHSQAFQGRIAPEILKQASS